MRQGTLRRPGRSWLIGVLLFICILSGYLLSFNVDKPTHNADWYIRYQVTCGIVERNAFYIHPYDTSQRDGIGVDGRYYTEYTLGQSVAMIPLYMLGRVLAGLPHTNCDQTIAPPIVFLTAKTLDMILGALLGVLFFATARLLGYARLPALALTALFAFGSSLWPDVLSGEEHTMESLFLLAGAYAALRYTLQRRKNWVWVLVMGLAAGLVFVARVAGAIAIPIFALYLLVLHWRARPEGSRPAGWKRLLVRDLAIYGAGVLPSLLVNAAFDMIRFGSPLSTHPPLAHPDPTFGFPPWIGIPDLLISPGKGLFWYTPAVFLLLVAVRPFWRRFPLPAILFGIICGVYLVFYGDVTYWHGDPAWGPRYLYAILPYVLLPLGEVLRRWRSFRLPMRGLFVAVLAASFLVQFSAVTVSYWRHWHFIYGYHYDQVENHGWGQNNNYFWFPDQSPIWISLSGIVSITQDYVDHAPLLWHPVDQRLSNPYESCIFAVYGQASICLTDLDDLHDNGEWNTFTPWWVHTFPWWNKTQVISIALAVLAVFVLSGGGALLLLRRAARSTRPGTYPAAREGPRGGPAPQWSNAYGHGNGAGSAGNGRTRGIDVSPPLAVGRPSTGIAVRAGPAPAAVTAPAATGVMASPALAARPAPAVRLLGSAVLLAAIVYGGIAGVAALRAPAHAPPLIRSVAMNTIVHDGKWAYQVLGVTSMEALPGGIAPPVDPAHHFVIVHLRLYNDLTRPHHVRIESFDLTDSDGLLYPWMDTLRGPVAELYHLTPFGMQIPARSAMDGALIFLVRNSARHLALLGPGIALVQLSR